MRRFNSLLAAVLSLGFAIMPSHAAEDPAGGAPASPAERLHWMKGPAKADLKGIAEIRVPEGFAFLGAKETRQVLEAAGNPTSGSELGLLAPTSRVWAVVFEFSSVGYVKDDDKNELDADKLLKTISDGTEGANKYRKRKGVPALHITGWE